MRDFAVCAWYHAQFRAVNLSLNSELIAEARRAKLNLSAIAEDAIGAALTDLAAERFSKRSPAASPSTRPISINMAA